MPTITSGWLPDGSFRTASDSVQAPPIANPGPWTPKPLAGLDELMAEWARRRALSAPTSPLRARSSLPIAPPVREAATPERPYDPLASLRTEVEAAKMQALLNPPPMKAVTGFNQIGSAGGMDVMDPSVMSGIQRQMYLPQGSSFTSPYAAPPVQTAAQYSAASRAQDAEEERQRRLLYPWLYPSAPGATQRVA